MSLKSPYFDALRSRVVALGGFYNAHLHLDRAGTLSLAASRSGNGEPAKDGHLSLPEKHRRFAAIHASEAFEKENFLKRINYFLDAMVDAGTRRADTLVDVVPGKLGMSVLEQLLEIKAQRSNEIDLRLAAYSPMGFDDADPARWQMVESAAQLADFVGSLPERDDRRVYPDHIGFREHCRRVLRLVAESGKPLQIHLDQHNDSRERETEVFLEVLRDLRPDIADSSEPSIWIVHFISPALYEESRFARLVDQLLEFRIGVICCPSAALSMRQLRPLSTPTSNSIARVLDLAAAGVPVALGSDNIDDICSPAGTPDLCDEVFVLCNALRFYDIDILAKLAAGRPLSCDDRDALSWHLEQDREQVRRSLEFVSDPDPQ